MKFPFLKCDVNTTPAFPNRKSTVRPIIPIRVFNSTTSTPGFRIDALLDTGADYCLFNSGIAPVVGISHVRKGAPMILYGIAGKVTAYFHNVILEVGGWKFKTKIGLADTVQTNLLGKHGFLDFFKVTFDYKKEEIELKRLDSSKFYV